ncbi:hypothetical protein PG984_014888 [Apiospora sp. TS-2023a]
MAAIPEWLSGCQTCQDIWRRFTDPTFQDAINFGSPADALSTSCAAHRPLVERFVDVLRAEKPGRALPATTDIGISRAHPKQAGRPRVCESLSNGGIFWELLLAQPEGRPDHHPGTARVLDPDWADLEMLKGWKDECLLSHGSKCENPMRIPSVRPAWLIDVGRKCLVSGSVTDAPYLTLTYVYGEHVAPNIDAEKFAELQETNALETLENSEYVLPIVKHAMGLTSVLGERYLWVDQLCIPHSDPASAREEQAMQMGAIYANAVVTIIAADGDPKRAGPPPRLRRQGGLLGLRGISEPRDLRQRVVALGDETLVVHNKHVYEFRGGAKWTVPITTWYTGHFPSIADVSQRREIKSAWYEERDRYYKDFSRPLPPGWTRHAAPETNHFGQARVFPDGCGEYVFRHEAMPETHPDLGPRAEWYYPFPVPSVGPSGPPGIMPEQTPYLFCETARVWLWGRQAERSMCNEIILHDGGSGYEVGKLYLPNRSYLDAFPKGPVVAIDDDGEHDERNEKRGLRVELVAIYKSRLCKLSLDKETRRYGLPVRRSERYTVLWVEWKEGIAYRLASGHVRAEVWDKLEKEQVSLF